jgi:hypothetical protein
MPIPLDTGKVDLTTGWILPTNTGTWANLISTVEISLSNVTTGNTTATLIAGNVSFGNLTFANTTCQANSNVITLTTSSSSTANLSVGMQVYRSNVANGTTITAITNQNSTWDTWTTWIKQPALYTILSTDPVDTGLLDPYNLEITADITGNVTYTVRTSIDGEFSGNETVANLTPGITDVAAFEGRFYSVTANVTTESSMAVIKSMVVSVKQEPLLIQKGNISTASLAGTSSSRQLDIGRNVSYIYALQMTPHLFVGGSGYTVSGYVTNGYFDETIITGAFPQIVDKLNGGANIALTDNEGNFIDGRVDVTLSALPEQYRDGKNFRLR